MGGNISYGIQIVRIFLYNSIKALSIFPYINDSSLWWYNGITSESECFDVTLLKHSKINFRVFSWHSLEKKINLCYKELRKLWRQKVVQPSKSEMHSVK